jgi:flagellar assembly factor FliW
MKAAAPLNTPPDPSVDPAGQDAPVVSFPAGIPGFETCRRFVVIASPELAPLACLKALDPPEASFLTIDPRLVDRDYDLTLREFERVRLGAGDEPLVWLAIVTVTGDKATANLRAPIVINPRRMVGCQFIRDDRDYPVHFPLGGA